MPACYAKAHSAFQPSVCPRLRLLTKVVLMCQAVPKPAAMADSATAADQPRDESLSVTNRSGKAKKLQRQKGKGSGSSPVLQLPVLCSVLPCLQKLELHITGGYIASCLHYYACVTELPLLCLHCYGLHCYACSTMLAVLCFNCYGCITVLA